MNNLGSILKELRKDNGLSQVQLSKITGISQQNISNWENNVYIPNINDYIKLANALNCSIDYLAGLENEDYTKNYTPSNTLELPEDITEIIEIYLTLNDRDKYLLRAYLNAMVISNEDHQ